MIFLSVKTTCFGGFFNICNLLFTKELQKDLDLSYKLIYYIIINNEKVRKDAKL